MSPDRLIEIHPTLYHMADARNWEGIRRHGLLSTTALLDRFSVAGPEREAAESSHRPGTIQIPSGGPHPDLGLALIRDQRPLQPAALAACLDGLTCEQWRLILNGRVFFWPTTDRLGRMLKSYVRDAQDVFEVDTRRLIDRHGDRVELSHINSGFASEAYRPVMRGASTFTPLAGYAHSSKNAIAEVTIPYAVPDIFDSATRVTRRKGGQADFVLWQVGDG